MDNNSVQYKEELLENISELFVKFGLRSTSMDDIANHLKISKKTLYQHFLNKDDVIEQVMLHRRKVRGRQADMEGIQKMNPIEVMNKIKTYMLNDLTRKLPSNYFDMKKYHPVVYQKIVKKDEEYTKCFLTELIKEGIDKGYFRSGIDSELQIYLLGKQLSFLEDPEIYTKMAYPIEIIVEAIIDNFLMAISTEKGIQEIEKRKKTQIE